MYNMAQNMSICNFCELSNKIKWKCINCDLILCEECKTIKHPKFKGSEYHTVIEFHLLGTKEATNAKRKLDLQKIMCSGHCEEKCCLYCQNCKIPICLSCILGKHSGHKAAKIEVVYDNQYIELEKFRHALELDISLSAERSISLHERKQSDLNGYTAIKEKIFEREKGMKCSVSEQAAKLIKKLDEIFLSDYKFITNVEKKVQKYEEDLNLKKAMVDETLDSCQATSVLNTVCKFNFKIPQKNFEELQNKQTAIFTEVEPEVNINLQVLKVERIIGITKVYDMGETIISILKTLENGAYVMMNDENKTIVQFVFLKGKCECVKSVKVDAFDLTVNREGTVFVSCVDSEVIYNITNSGKENFKSVVSPREARGVHSFDNQTLYVGFIDYSNKEAGIVIFDLKSDHNQEFKTETDDFFNCIPEKITSYINGDICVVQSDNTSSWEGMIVSYEITPSLGQVKWKYEGHEDINKVKDFSPCDIDITSAGLVLTVDRSTNVIHVLSTNGSFLTFIGAREGVYYPRSLNVDKAGQLLIGSNNKNGKSAKIYVAKFIP